MPEDEMFVKRARLIIEMVMLMDIEPKFIDECIEDAECRKTLSEITLTIGEDDWWGDE